MNRLTRFLRGLLSLPPLGASVRLPTEPVPPAWPRLVADRVPMASRLPATDRERLYRLMQLFLREVPIEGCAGLEVTEEVRVTIAAQACFLLLKMSYPRYTRLRRVLVYPSTFLPKRVGMHPSGQVVRPEAPLLGQAWQTGIVVLGWDAVLRSALSATDGHNVVLHEFAHILDAEDGTMDGVPVLDSGSAYRAWAAMLTTQFAEHVARAEQGDPTTLDPYGAENRAEFFAVATEAFFERPVALREDQPRLYELLVDFYKLDPASWEPPPASGAP